MLENPLGIPELIQEMRQRLHLSQTELAKKLGVSFHSINRWEKGKTYPLPLALKQVEALLHQMGEQGQDLLDKYQSFFDLVAQEIANILNKAKNCEQHKPSEQHLQLYADIVQNIEVAITVWQLEDPNDPGSLRLLMANPSASLATGLNFQELIGTTFAENFPSLLGTPLLDKYLEVIRTGQAQDLGEVTYSEGKVNDGIYRVKAFCLPNNCLGLAFENITTQKQTESRLENSQRFNQQITEALPGILFVHDLIEQKNIYTNRQIADLLGYTSQQIKEMGADVLPCLIHPDDLNRILTFFNQFSTVPDNTVLGIEYRVHHANGEWRWLYSQAVLFERTANGLASKVVGFSLDITDRKKVEKALQESEQRLQLAQQSARIGTWDWNLLTHDISWSDGIWNLLGVERDSIIPSPEAFMKFIHPDDLERVSDKIKNYLGQGGDFYDEFRIIRPDKTISWLISKGRTITNKNGQIERFLGVNIDITARKQMEKTLQETEAKLKSFVDANVVGILFGDIYGNIHQANDELLRIIGYSREDLNAGRLRWLDITPPEYLPLDEEQIALARATGACIPYEKEYIRSDGTRVPVIVGYSLVGEERENSIAFILDLSERKQAEAEREKLLAREQAAREQAETANRIKDEFLAVLSHELRSPLNPILGWAKLLQSQNLEPEIQAKGLITIERNATLQAQLIEDLLDISRILQGKLNLKPVSVNLAFIIESALETVRLAAEAKSIQIQSVLNPNVGHVLGDPARLQQIVWNLLSNAVKFTPKGGKVQIVLERVDELAQITVSDTGQGISADFLPYVFDCFRQANSSTTRKFGGLGLGLAIVRHLLELHGGTISAESLGLEQGATFTVKLPLLSQPSPINSTKPTVLAQPTSLPLDSLQILVIDDDADTRNFLTFLLEHNGANVTAVASANEALQAFADSTFDLFLSDIGMPLTDGYTLIQQIRAVETQQKKPPLKAIALTAYAKERDQQLALEKGFQKHLSKPVDPYLLIKTIVELIL